MKRLGRGLGSLLAGGLVGLALAAGAYADDGNGTGSSDSSAATASQPASPDNSASAPSQSTGTSAPDNSAATGNGNGNGNSGNAPGQNKPSQGSPSPNASPEAQHHVIICHKTGSTSHPWVVINVDIAAWPAHKAHGDVLLKDPAKPGEKLPVSACPHVSSGASAGVTSGTNSSTRSGVAGATATSSNGGVLGARTGVAGRSGSLPFTGASLWLAAALGGVMLGSGLALRRYAKTR